MQQFAALRWSRRRVSTENPEADWRTGSHRGNVDHGDRKQGSDPVSGTFWRTRGRLIMHGDRCHVCRAAWSVSGYLPTEISRISIIFAENMVPIILPHSISPYWAGLFLEFFCFWRRLQQNRTSLEYEDDGDDIW